MKQIATIEFLYPDGRETDGIRLAISIDNEGRAWVRECGVGDPHGGTRYSKSVTVNGEVVALLVERER